MDKKENTIRTTEEKYIPNRRSSILKIPKVPNEENVSTLKRRVSFSSNFIKTFTTDGDKNTIWDSTLEETLSAGESLNSNVDICSVEHTDSNKIVTSSHERMNCSINEPEDFEVVANVLNASIPGKESQSLEDAAMSESCLNKSVMDFTCVEPISFESNSDPDLQVNKSATMEFTCVNPISSIFQPGLHLNKSATMEFTCVNPLPIKSSTESESQLDKTASMEFTCVNPIPIKSTAGSETQLDKTASMEFTCVNPILIKSTAGSEPQLDKTATMEFTCVNPIPIKSTAGSKSQLDNTAKMEFTCVNPIPIKCLQDGESTSQSKRDCDKPSISGLTNEFNLSQFPTRNLMDKTDSLYISELNVSEGISLIKSSRDQISNMSAQMNVEHTIQLPHLDLTNNTECSMKFPYSQSTFPKNIDANISSKNIPVDGVPGIVRNPKYTESNFMSKETSLSNEIDSSIDNSSLRISTKNSFIDVPSFGNIDDTQQLLRDASLYTSPTNITLQNNNLDTTLKGSINKTFAKDDNERKKENISFDHHNMRVFDPETINNIEEKFESQNALNLSTPGYIEDHFILDESTVDLIENSADENCSSDISDRYNNSKSFCEQNDHEFEKLKKDETLFMKESLKEDFTALEFQALLDSENETYLLEFNNIHPQIKKFEEPISVEELEVKANQVIKSVKENFEKFKKKLDNVLEYCKNNKFVPDELTDDDDDDNDLYNGNNLKLPARKGLFEEIEEKSSICDRSWRIIKVENGFAEFTTFCDKIQICLEYSSHDYSVINFRTKSLVAEKAKPRAKLLEKEFLKLLSEAHMNKSIGNRYTVLSLLDYLQIAMDKIRAYYTVLKDFEKVYGMCIDDEYIASFMLLDTSLLLKWNFTIDLSSSDNINKNSVTIKVDIGEVDTNHFLKIVDDCPKGLEFLKTYVTKVQEYLKYLKNKRSISLKKFGRKE